MNSVASTLNRVTYIEFNNQISVLTQNNWNTWKHDMQVLLMHYGCWQFIIQTKPEQPDEEATYKEKLDLQLCKDRCYTLIYTNISSDLKNLITETTDGVAAWKILKDHFEPVTKARIIQPLDQFFGTKYQPGEDVGIFISRVKTAATRLQEAGHKLDDLYIGFQLMQSNFYKAIRRCHIPDKKLNFSFQLPVPYGAFGFCAVVFKLIFQ
ncbi:uncharacterized protein TNCV_5101111 [Trichonephila clavipes]|nr:uncharacterized protein TNCV_5101111 [Trichonephila clavipes]